VFRLVANAEGSSLALTVEPFSLERFDGIDDVTVDDLHAHAPVEEKRSVVVAAGEAGEKGEA
jgi:hypothetical protein